MGQTLKLNDVLASLQSDGVEETATEKTASVATTGQSRTELLAILNRGKDTSVEKTASVQENTPAGDLEKIAADVQAAETEALVKEAQFYGAAICDGFMARMSQYEEAAGIVRDQDGDEAPAYDREKQASEIYNEIEPEAVEMAEGLIKEAADEGVELSGEEALEKVAEAVHAQGYNETMEKIAEDFREAGYDDAMEKIAEDFFEAGYEETMEKVAEDVRALAFEETLEKIAQDLHDEGEEEALNVLTKVAFDQGYEDAMEKIAESAFNHGYDDMAQLLQQQAG